MRTLLFILLLLPVLLHAQTDFTGVIDYRFTNADTTLDIRVEAAYIPGKVRFTLHPVKAPKGADVKHELVIIDFKKAAIYRIKEEEKKIEIEKIGGSNSKQDIPALALTDTSQILDMPVLGYSSGWVEKKEAGEKDSVSIRVMARFWYASQLLFPIPDSLSREQMVPLFSNGRVCLGFELLIRSPKINIDLISRAQQWRKESKTKLAKLFRLPKNYTIKRNN